MGAFGANSLYRHLSASTGLASYAAIPLCAPSEIGRTATITGSVYAKTWYACDRRIGDTTALRNVEGSIPMKARRYQQLNPMALAIAAGCTALIAPLLIGFPMMGIGGMMGGHGGGGMWGYHSAYAVGFGMFWIAGAFLSALLGAIFAWIYNAVNAAPRADANAGEPGSRPNVPPPR
jgi:hypothetical protein